MDWKRWLTEKFTKHKNENANMAQQLGGKEKALTEAGNLNL